MLQIVQKKNVSTLFFIIILISYKNNASFLNKIEKSKKNVSALKEKASGVKDKIKQNKDSVKQQIDEAKGKFDETKGKFDETKGKFDEAKGKFDEAKGKFDEAKGKFDEAKGKVSNLKKQGNENLDKVKNNFDGDENFDAKVSIDNVNANSGLEDLKELENKNIVDSQHHHTSEQLKNNENYFIISADVNSEISNYCPFCKTNTNGDKIFSVLNLKKRIVNNNFLLIFFIFIIIILVLSVLNLCYSLKKDKTVEIFISGLYSCFHVIMIINYIFILRQRQSYSEVIADIVRDFFLSYISIIVGVFLGILIMKEYASKKKIP